MANLLQQNIDTNCSNEVGAVYITALLNGSGEFFFQIGETPLILASAHGHKEIVKLLLSTYIDINSCTKVQFACSFAYRGMLGPKNQTMQICVLLNTETVFVLSFFDNDSWCNFSNMHLIVHCMFM